MKSSTIILILSIIVIAAGLAGCTGSERPETPATTVPTPAAMTTPVPTTITLTPQTSVPLTTVPTTARPAATPSLTSADDIRNHFLDVTYTSTNRLERLNYSATKPRVVVSVISASDDDIAVIETAARAFNDASPTVKISENIKENENADLFIKFLSQDGLAVINLNEVPVAGPFPEALTRRELYQDGEPAAKIVRGTIYINANLRNEARNHVLVRSLMYEMGLTGESTRFPDSVFYAGENTNTELTPADRKIISMLYAQGFSNGMNMEDLKKVIYLP
ncbi:MAG TPA: DUF2927 domain-containing protein [Methanoregula sp.]|nr:DUF2927 domain-containing protein [Methanoregula sp.]